LPYFTPNPAEPEPNRVEAMIHFGFGRIWHFSPVKHRNSESNDPSIRSFVSVYRQSSSGAQGCDIGREDLVSLDRLTEEG
jgi:hypothetical protein